MSQTGPGSIIFCDYRASTQHFLWVSLHVFSAHVFFGFQPLLVTMTQTSMHVPLHVLIIHHSPSRKDVHSISTEGQSALPTPSLGWLNPSSPIPQFLSHQRRPRHWHTLQLFMLNIKLRLFILFRDFKLTHDFTLYFITQLQINTQFHSLFYYAISN